MYIVDFSNTIDHERAMILRSTWFSQHQQLQVAVRPVLVLKFVGVNTSLPITMHFEAHLRTKRCHFAKSSSQCFTWWLFGRISWPEWYLTNNVKIMYKSGTKSKSAVTVQIVWVFSWYKLLFSESIIRQLYRSINQSITKHYFLCLTSDLLIGDTKQ